MRGLYHCFVRVLLTGVLCVCPLIARADTLFTFSDAGAISASFILPTGFTMANTTPYGFTVNGVQATINGTPYIQSVSFDQSPFLQASSFSSGFAYGANTSTYASGGLGAGSSSLDPYIGLLLFNTTIFSGSPSNPVFIEGSYTSNRSRLTIADVVPAATPEPSSIVLLGTGVLSFAGLVRRRHRHI